MRASRKLEFEHTRNICHTCSTPAQVNLCAPACNLLLAAALPSFDNVRTRWQYLVSLSKRSFLGHRLPALNASSC